LLKVTPTGRKIFMLAYVANDGQRRKPAIGRFGEITVEQARGIAQDGLADVRKGQDPSVKRSVARQGPTVEELFERFMSEYSEGRNEPATVKSNRGHGKRHVIPILGHLKVRAVTRGHISHLMKRISKAPTNANRVLSALRKMFNWRRSGVCALTGRTHAGWTAFSNRIRLFGRSGQRPPPRAEVESAADTVKIGIENRRDIERQQLGE
jgi:hypothetical protein